MSRARGRRPRTTGRLSITEEQFQTWVIEVAKLHGWRIVHFRAAIVEVDDDGNERWATPLEGDEGFPDLIMARDGELLVRELKSHTGRLRRGQQEWLDELGEFGGIWRPGMEALILQALSRPWKVQRTALQRGLRLVDLLAMEERLTRALESVDDDGSKITLHWIRTGRADAQV